MEQGRRVRAHEQEKVKVDVNRVRPPKVQAKIPAKDKAADRAAVKAVDKAVEAEDKLLVFKRR